MQFNACCHKLKFISSCRAHKSFLGMPGLKRWQMILLTLFNLISEPSVCSGAVASCDWQHYMFIRETSSTSPFCPPEIAQLRNVIYILFDINPLEGFNLRRDVYVRLAVFVHQLQQRGQLSSNVRLVLPPWPRLFHWKSMHLYQENLPWRLFFDITSLQRYAPVLDFPEFLEEIAQFGMPETPYIQLNKVFQLLHFEEMFENGVFLDRFEYERDCRREQYLQGNFLLQQPLLLLDDNDFECVRFQGSAHMLERVLKSAFKSNQTSWSKDEPKVFAFLNAEIVLHEHWGGKEFWRARRSMRFAAPLVAIADEFRLRKFNSTNTNDMVQRPPMWESEQPKRNALGGDYLCAHLRRGDFIYGREESTPTLESAATQIRVLLHSLNLSTVFLATDANAFEVKNLKSHLFRMRVIRFSAETLEQKARIKEGGVAIIDQLICSYARSFIGTYLSTFTYRIYEEREILGFQKSATFNTFCKSEKFHNCSRNSIWPIVF